MNSSNDISPTASFGEELRKAREFRHISLRDISGITRISQEFLAALEAGDVDRIPGPIRRGIVSSYASAVGLNKDRVLKEYDALSAPREKASEAVLLRTPARERMMVGMTRSQVRTAWFAKLSSNTRLHWIMTAALIVIGSAGALLARRQLTREDAINPRELTLAVEYDSSLFDLPFRFVRESLLDSPIIGTMDWEIMETFVIAKDTVEIESYAGIQEFWRGSMYPYDTIAFKHKHGLRVEVRGADRILVTSAQDTVPGRTLRDSLNYYFTYPFDSTGSDSSAAIDSIGSSH